MLSLRCELPFWCSSIWNIDFKLCMCIYMYAQWAEISYSTGSKFFFFIAEVSGELWLIFNSWKSKEKKIFIPSWFRSFAHHRLASGPCIRPHCGFVVLSVSLCLATGTWATPHAGCSANCCCFTLLCQPLLGSLAYCASAVQLLVFFDFTLSLNVVWLGTCLVNYLSHLIVRLPVTSSHMDLFQFFLCTSLAVIYWIVTSGVK